MLFNSATLNSAPVNGAAGNVVSLAQGLVCATSISGGLNKLTPLGALATDPTLSSGGLLLTTPLASAATAATSVSGVTSQNVPLAASVTAQTTVSPNLIRLITLVSGVADGIVGAAPFNTFAFNAADPAFISTGSTASGTVKILNVVTAVAQSVSTATGYINDTIPLADLAGSGFTTVVSNSALAQTTKLSGAPTAVTSASGAEKVNFVVSSTANAVTSGTGLTQDVIPLFGNSSPQASSNTQFYFWRDFAASVQAPSSSSAGLKLNTLLTGGNIVVTFGSATAHYVHFSAVSPKPLPIVYKSGSIGFTVDILGVNASAEVLDYMYKKAA